MGFLSHNSGSRHGRRSIKGSKDADDHLVSKKNWVKTVAFWIGAQGRVKLVKNAKTSRNCCVTNRKPQTQNEKKFFSFSTRRLAESVGGLNSFLAQSAGES